MKIRKIFAIFSITFFCIAGTGGAEEDGLRQSAESGNAEAQFALANEYFYGTETRKQNPELAAYWFLKAASAGLPAAQFNYAICLEQGYGVKKDQPLAAEYYRSAYESGNHHAGFNLAMLLLHDLDQKEEARHVLKGLTEKQHASAMTELAALMFKTEEQDRESAFRLLEQACSLPGATAKGFRMLADCHYGGSGTERNQALAEKYLKKAVAMNDPEAMARLAFLHEEKAETEQAFRLYRKAAENGLAFGEYKYAEYICEGGEPGKGLDAALELYKSSAEKNCPQALTKLALFAMTGIGMDAPDKPRAAALFEKAAQTGHIPAMYNLACMYAAGDGIPQDDKRAFFWFGNAAVRGHAASMRKLGGCYYRGAGCLKDNEKASEWIKAAAEAGDFLAQEMIRQGSRSAW